jgi:3-hydroxyacyl-[acyl-carrier-protein] dehydratase
MNFMLFCTRKTMQNSLMDILEIMRRLPHRYPFLLVDRVLKLEPKQSIEALKNVTINEPFFQGHFPGHPVMPGVLIIEALAQASGLLAMASLDEPPSEDMIVYFAGIDECRFKRVVTAGDQLILKAQLLSQKRMIGKFSAQAFVGDQLAAEAQLLAALRTKE